MEPVRHGASLPGAGRHDARDGGVREALDARDLLPMQRRRREQEQQVASLVCLECGDESDEAGGWRAYLDDDELLVYCS